MANVVTGDGQGAYLGSDSGQTEQKLGSVPLIIRHVATDSYVSFNSILLRTFKDTFNTNYNSQEVYGRMDPIMTFQGTTRKITLGFDLETGGNEAVSSRFLAMVTQLMWFQYPVYEQADNALSMSRPPLVTVKLANYIRGGDGGPLLCALNGVSYSPFDKFQLGESPMLATPVGGSETHLMPMRISVDLDLTVLHRPPPGWLDFQDRAKFIGGEQWGKVDLDKVYAGAGTAGTTGQIGRLAKNKDIPSFASEGIPEAQNQANVGSILGGGGAAGPEDLQ